MTNDRVSTMFSPVTVIRASDEIASQIDTAIRDGQLKEGDRLPSERELTAIFGASRTAVREALRLLEGSHRVTTRRGAKGGVFITEPDARMLATALESMVRFRRAGVEEMAEFRPDFEGANAKLAAERATPEARTAIKDAATRYLIEAEKCAPWAALVDVDLDFHQLVAQGAGNEIRTAISLGLHRCLRTASLQLADRPEVDRLAEAEDLQVIALAIEVGAGQRAQDLMIDHIRKNSRREIAAAHVAGIVEPNRPPSSHSPKENHV